MTDTSDQRAIGRLEGKIDLMLAEQEKAALARKQTYDKLEALDRKMTATEVKVENVEERLKSVEEPVAEFSRWRERGVGAIMLISFVAATIGGLLVTFGKKVWASVVGG